jgi:hypothetical protein
VKQIVLCWVVAVAGLAGAADFAIDGPATPAKYVGAAADAEMELAWDNGTRQWSISWYTGVGSWVGNDFDLSTLTSYRAIEKIRFYSRDTWPNNQWDGCRIGVYAFSSVPGSLLWGPTFCIGSGTGHTWCDFTVGWTLPAGMDSFVAAVEQYYNYPDCDPFGLDINPTFVGRSWEHYRGEWSPLSTSVNPYRNLMLRVVVVNEKLNVIPSSLGRVKATYR